MPKTCIGDYTAYLHVTDGSTKTFGSSRLLFEKNTTKRVFCDLRLPIWRRKNVKRIHLSHEIFLRILPSSRPCSGKVLDHFGRHGVQISAGLPFILIDIFRSLSFHTNANISGLPSNMPKQFSFQILTYHSWASSHFIRRCISLTSEAALSNNLRTKRNSKCAWYITCSFPCLDMFERNSTKYDRK